MFCLLILKTIVSLHHNNKQIGIMKAIEVQKEMNNAYVNKSYKKAYRLFLIMNNLRVIEGLSILTMPNLQSKFE